MINDALNQIAAAYGSIPLSTGAQTVYLPSYAFQALEDTTFGVFYDGAGSELAFHPYKGKTLESGSIAFFGQDVYKFTVTSGGKGLLYPSAKPSEVYPALLSCVSSEDGATLSLTYDRPVSSVGLSAANFFVSINGAAAEAVATVSVNGTNNKVIDITLTTGLLYGDTATISYVQAVNSLFGAKGSAIGPITNEIPDTPPALVSAATNVTGTLIILTFDQDMMDPSDYAADFSAEVDGAGVTVSGVALGNDTATIELTLSAEVEFGESVTVSMDAGNIKSALNVPAEALEDESVTNNTEE